MEEVLGVLGLAAYIVAVVSLAAGITYAVIKIFPTKRDEPKDGEAPADDKPAKPEPKKSSDDAPAGSLFRRSKRNRS